MQSPSINGVVRLAITGPASVGWDELLAQVRCGESWNFSAPVPHSLGETDSKNSELVGSGVIVSFSSRPYSMVRTANGTINWQGDLRLGGVPLIQASCLIAIFLTAHATLQLAQKGAV